MKIFQIKDRSLDNRGIGYLLYFERNRAFIVELEDDLTEWQVPVLFSSFVKKGIFTIPKDVALLWVQERVAPPARQNIGMILHHHKMKEYDEMRLLALANGRSSQDDCEISPLKSHPLPMLVAERMADNLSDCLVSENGNLIGLFQDDTVREIAASGLQKKNPSWKPTLSHKEILESVAVDTGGYGISFRNGVTINKHTLQLCGNILPMRSNDFYAFARKRIVSTPEACQILDITKQNLAYLVKKNRLTPIKENMKENIFFKGDVERL